MTKKGVNAFTLFKVPGESEGKEEGTWKISGVADTHWDMADGASNTSEEITESMMAPINKFLALMSKRDWDGLHSVLLPGGGMSHSAANEPIQCVLFPVFVEKLSEIIARVPKEVDMVEKIFKVEGRVCGDLAVVWTPFFIEFDGVKRTEGVNIWWVVKRSTGWIIAGCQDWGRAVKAE